MRAAKVKAGCYQGGGHARTGFACGGRVKHADGGAVGGDMAVSGGQQKPRLDRAPRGGKSNGASTVNVIVAPKPDVQPPMPMGGPPPVPPPAPAPVPPMMPAGAAPGMPAGAPMFARGGRVKRAWGGPAPNAAGLAMGGPMRAAVEPAAAVFAPNGPMRALMPATGGAMGMRVPNAVGAAMRAKGGRVGKADKAHPDETQDKVLIKQKMAEEKRK